MPTSSRLAWLLRTVSVLQAGAILAFLFWRWPAAPVQAVAGAFALAAIAPLVLAFEFVMLSMVARTDPAVPRPGTRDLVRAWACETANLARVFYGRLPWTWQIPPDLMDPACAGRTGVVLVHGFVCNRGFWAPWMLRLRREQRAHVAVNLEPVFGGIDDYVPIIEGAVQRVTQLTGRPPVLVCHSMGGLAARAWLRAAASPTRVAHLVTIGSPHHGTWLGRFSSMRNGRQMRLQSRWLADLERFERRTALPPALCWYSNCDNIVFPASTATLPRADNRFLSGQAHVAMAFHPRVLDETLNLFKSVDTGAKGEFVTKTGGENT